MCGVQRQLEREITLGFLWKLLLQGDGKERTGRVPNKKQEQDTKKRSKKKTNEKATQESGNNKLKISHSTRGYKTNEKQATQEDSTR